MGCLLLACGKAEEQQAKVVPAPVMTTPIDTAAVRAKAIETDAEVFKDTLHLPGGAVVRLEPISREAFDAIPPTQQVKLAGETSKEVLQAEKQHIGLDSIKVKRDGLSLLLQPEQGPLIKLTNSAPVGEADDYYFYLTSLSDTRHWLIDMGLDGELSYYLLIDQKTGDRDTLIEFPVLSPSRGLIACGATSGSAGYGPEGLELWHTTEQGEFARSWYREMWGVREVRWENDHTLLLLQEWVSGTPDAKRRYVRLRLPQ